MANLMYRCSEKAGCTNVKCRGEGFQNKNCECMCPGSPVRSCADTTPGPGDGASTETNAVIKLQSEPCVDKDSSCEDWSGKGFCQGKNAVHVRNSCPKACGLCL
ncbi:zinc metalloproteinase nas-15-like [Pomacea canaliculata]|uniref:zinc metalloproteinase nas-15-like n=1 Tax=Pomacea canaliculata TaxID=400727 RepID=UPI000D7311AC|nr:zinc metalloproteinase nas-15-like [Pomacea canaliculata]